MPRKVFPDEGNDKDASKSVASNGRYRGLSTPAATTKPQAGPKSAAPTLLNPKTKVATPQPAAQGGGLSFLDRYRLRYGSSAAAALPDLPAPPPVELPAYGPYRPEDVPAVKTPAQAQLKPTLLKRPQPQTGAAAKQPNPPAAAKPPAAGTSGFRLPRTPDTPAAAPDGPAEERPYSPLFPLRDAQPESPLVPFGSQIDTPDPADYGELASIVERLPDSFPIDTWDEMKPAQQQQALQRSRLTEQEKWELLNADVPIKTLATMQDIEAHYRRYGLTKAEAGELTQQLWELGYARFHASATACPSRPAPRLSRYWTKRRRSCWPGWRSLDLATADRDGMIWMKQGNA